jgi:hypothetical protein
VIHDSPWERSHDGQREKNDDNNEDDIDDNGISPLIIHLHEQMIDILNYPVMLQVLADECITDYRNELVLKIKTTTLMVG